MLWATSNQGIIISSKIPSNNVVSSSINHHLQYHPNHMNLNITSNCSIWIIALRPYRTRTLLLLYFPPPKHTYYHRTYIGQNCLQNFETHFTAPHLTWSLQRDCHAFAKMMSTSGENEIINLPEQRVAEIVEDRRKFCKLKQKWGDQKLPATGGKSLVLIFYKRAVTPLQDPFYKCLCDARS